MTGDSTRPGMDRRDFITWSAGGGLALAFGPAALARGAALSPWIELHADGGVTLTTTALEMGQGSRTGQAQILADELDVPWEAVRTVMATETAPYLVDDALFSGGSQTVRTRFALLRQAGADVRQRLIVAAARRWRVPASECRAALGVVTHPPSGRSAPYGALAALAATVPTPVSAPLKPAGERRYIGRPMRSLAVSDKTDGKAQYGIDFRLPDMVFASLRQCPSFGGTLTSCDDARALAIGGVQQVVRLKDAVAVVADSSWPALRGIAALDPQWTVAKPVPDSAAISAPLTAALDAPDAVISPREGGAATRAQLRAAWAAAERRHEADYETSFLSHSPLEPMNATARPLPGGGVEIWAPCQSPTWCRDDVVELLKLPRDKVVIHPLMMGGGFGRRLKGDYAARAAELALKIGKPVQLLWSREEDFAHGFYRPVLKMRARGTLDAQGLLDGYEVIAATTNDRTGAQAPAPYAIARHAATLSEVDIGVPVGAWRSVDPGLCLFGRESFIDECAHRAKIDPLTYRERLLGDNRRALRLLRAVAEAIGWTRSPGAGRGRGLAMLHEWDTMVAHAVEVDVRDGLRVTRIAVAADLGTIVNPGLVRAQFEGGALMGTSAALGERIDIMDGAVVQRNFDTYRVLRMAEAPTVTVDLFETPDAPIGGAGEPPVPGVAPAIANAIFAASGKRLRTLPLRLAFERA